MKRSALFFAVGGLLAACGSPVWKQVPHDQFFQRAPSPQLHPSPAPRHTVPLWETLLHSTVRPASESLNPGWWAERALGGRPALDVNHFGQVPDSSWFTNRINRHDLSAEAVARGPNRTEGPASDGPLTVLRGNIEGATPGFLVEDRLGQRFFVKFDPPAFPELASGAEVIATKILWAAGYAVPANHVVKFELDRLELSPEAMTKGEYERDVPMTEDMLRALISQVNPYPDGTIRALFSQTIPGKLLGPFNYRGIRADDPNDKIPHELRRSLRGLWLFSAWLNNIATESGNSMDTFVASKNDPDIGHLQHYLLDFGDALGSGGTKPKYIGEGYEGHLDWPKVLASLGTLGIWYRRWLPVERAPFRAVGVFESRVFDPEEWRPHLPNPAFDESTDLDNYWAASIMAQFGIGHVLAAVRQAQYSDPAAQAWILRVLLQRQFKILEWVFSRILPLDRPRVQKYTLRMDDLAVKAGLFSPDTVGYQWQARWNRDGQDVFLAGGENFVPEVDLTSVVQQARAQGRLDDEPFISITWSRPLPEIHPRTMQVHLRVLDDRLLLVAMEREVD